MRRAPLALLVALLTACAGSPPGIPDPIGYDPPAPGPSASASAAPSAAAAVAASPPAGSSASPAPAAAPAPLGFAGAGPAHGRPAVRWAIALADAVTGEALRVRPTLPTDVAGGGQVAFLPEPRTDEDGGFRVWLAHPRPGLAVRVTLTSPDEAQVLTAIAFEPQLGPLPLAGPSAAPAALITPAPAATTLTLGTARRLLQADDPALLLDAASSAQAALLRGPLAALRLLPGEAARPLLRTLHDAIRPLARPLAAAVDLKPALADTPLTRAGQPGDGHGQALATWLEAAGQAAAARNLVAGAIADLALALAAAAPAATVLPETPLWGTPLTIRRAAGDAAPVVRSTRTGQDLPALTRVALVEAAGGGLVADPAAGGDGTFTIRFQAMAGDRSLTTSGPAPAADAPTYFGFGQDGRRVRPIDCRFYVHDVVLIGRDGRPAPLTLAESAWQHEGAALIDLDTGTTPELNNQLTGRAPAGTYVGLRFKLGLPEDLVFADRAIGGGQRSPHPILAWDGHAASMGGALLQGRRFMRLELGIQRESGREQRLAFHLGGTGPSNPADPEARDFDPAATTFAQPNVAPIKLNDFDPRTDTVVADLQAFMAGVTLGSGGEYYPVTSEPAATGGVPASDANLPTGFALLRNLGLAGSGEQKLFRKAR